MKSILSPATHDSLREALHVATVAALMQSRRWAPGELAFQGGTSLHLVYGSPRFSEDLDFLINDAVDIGQIQSGVEKHLMSAPWVPAGLKLVVSKAKAKNPHSFKVKLSGLDVIGSVSVKVELWRASSNAMNALSVMVSNVAPNLTTPGMSALAGMRALVPALTLHEIYADKVFALVARPYLKPRDVFDLHWLTGTHPAGQSAAQITALTAADMATRLAIYPNETAPAWLAKAQARRTALLASGAAIHIAQDIARWLPGSQSLDANALVQGAVQALDSGVVVMHKLLDTGAGNGNGQ